MDRAAALFEPTERVLREIENSDIMSNSSSNSDTEESDILSDLDDDDSIIFDINVVPVGENSPEDTKYPYAQ